MLPNSGSRPRVADLGSTDAWPEVARLDIHIAAMHGSLISRGSKPVLRHRRLSWGRVVEGRARFARQAAAMMRSE